MKKFLVVLLACAMIFGFATTALADTQITEFSDIADQTVPAKNAIMKLAVLGVVEGNEGIGGAFRPADNLTRAEFAKIVCYLTDNVTLANSLTNVGSKFSDVSTGNWYTGWVNAAAQSGYFVGDPGGTFRPNANITMNEVVTVALRCAGYSDKLGSSSGNTIWPSNYVSKALSVGILDDVTFVGSAAATRADMAVICNEVLGINMVVHISNDIAYALALTQGTVDADGFSEVYYISNETNRGKIYETILHKAFKGVYYDVQVSPARVATSYTTEKVEILDEETGLGTGKYEDVTTFDGSALTFDETYGWYYEDFGSTELALNVNGQDVWDGNKKFEKLAKDDDNDTYTYKQGEGLASTYYVTGSNDLLDLAGMQVQMTVIDGKEICFVEVVSSKLDVASMYKSGTNVVAGGKSYMPSVTLGVDGKMANIDDLSADFVFPNTDASANKVWTLAASSSDDTFGGRLYLDKNGKVYAVKNYDAYNGLNNVSFGDDQKLGFSIYEKVDSNIVEFKGDASISTVKTDKDYVLYKDGEQVKFADLDENDLVYYLGKEHVGVKFFIAYAPVEGDLTNQTNTKLTLAGTGYRPDWNYYSTGDADAVASDYFQFSDDGGDTFASLNIRLPEDQIDSFGEAMYAKAYNFNRVAYVASNLNYSKIIGVITKISPVNEYNSASADKFSPQYQEMTIFNTEGKEVKYTFTKNFKNGYNAMLNTIDNIYLSDDDDIATHWSGIGVHDAITTEKGLEKGDIVQLSLDKSDNVKSVTKFAAFAPSGSTVATVQTSKNRITWGGTSFTLHTDAIVFSVSTDVNAYDDVALASVAGTLATDFYARQLVTFDVKASSDVMVLYLVGDTSTLRFGIHTGNAKDSGGMYYTIDGQKYYAAVSTSLPGTPRVEAYTISGGDVTFNLNYTITADSTNQRVYDVVTAVNTLYGNNTVNVRADWGTVSGWNSGSKYITLNSKYYYITSDTYVYDLDDDSVIENPAELKGRRVVVFYDRNGDITSVAALKAATDTVVGEEVSYALDATVDADTFEVTEVQLVSADGDVDATDFTSIAYSWLVDGTATAALGTGTVADLSTLTDPGKYTISVEVTAVYDGTTYTETFTVGDYGVAGVVVGAVTIESYTASVAVTVYDADGEEVAAPALTYAWSWVGETTTASQSLGTAATQSLVALNDPAEGTYTISCVVTYDGDPYSATDEDFDPVFEIDLGDAELVLSTSTIEIDDLSEIAVYANGADITSSLTLATDLAFEWTCANTSGAVTLAAADDEIDYDTSGDTLTTGDVFTLTINYGTSDSVTLNYTWL